MDLKILSYLEDNFSNLPTVHPITYKNGKIYTDFFWISSKEETKEFCQIPLEELLKDDSYIMKKRHHHISEN